MWMHLDKFACEEQENLSSFYYDFFLCLFSGI